MYFKILLTIIFSLNLTNIFNIGKEREPLTATVVFFNILFALICTFGLWYWI